MDEKKFATLELWGLPFTFAAAMVLYFSYQLTGGAVWTVLFGAVNDSVWEHVKVMTLPYLFWAVMELCAVRIPMRRMVVAKTAGLYVMAGSAAAFYYGYSYFAGRTVPTVDLFSAFACIGLGFLVSYRLAVCPRRLAPWFAAAAFALVVFLTMYLSFTVNPPKIRLFLDESTQSYGIPARRGEAPVFYVQDDMGGSV